MTLSAGSELLRRWKQFVGPEASRVDTALTVAATIGGTVGASWWSRRHGAGWAATAIIGAMAADLIGGAYVNNTRACVRWYERAGQDDGAHLRFAAAHIHPFVVAALDPGIGSAKKRAVWALTQYAALVASTVLIRSNMSHRRPLGLALTAGGLLLDNRLGSSTLMPWFAAAYYPKLLMGHAAGSLWADDNIGVDVPSPE